MTDPTPSPLTPEREAELRKSARTGEVPHVHACGTRHNMACGDGQWCIAAAFAAVFDAYDAQRDSRNTIILRRGVLRGALLLADRRHAALGVEAHDPDRQAISRALGYEEAQGPDSEETP